MQKGMSAVSRGAWVWALSLAMLVGVGVWAKTEWLPQAVSADGVALAQLPEQAQQTYRLIRAGGPFPYDKDGTVFGNRERLLPRQSRGHYREYTVKTPGSRDRGARRIVCGGSEPRQPQACYYSADHYASFRLIAAAPELTN